MFEGIVPNVQPFYHRASVCIAPLLTGSGTRLKILEAMSFGNPVVSTIIGAEGIGYEKGKHLQVADMPELFASAITSLLQNNYRFNSQRVDARKLVEENYDWKVIGEKMNTSIHTLLK